MKTYDIYSALRDATNEGKSMVFTEARGDAWKRIANSPAHAGLVKQLREEGARFKTEPITSILFSKYKLFELTGDRSEFEYGYYFPRRARLAYLCSLTLLDGGEDNISALEDIIWAICDEYSWCVSAHLHPDRGMTIVDKKNAEDFIQNGYTGKTFREHRECVDLFAAETGFALSETISLLGDKLHPLVVDRAKKEVLSRIIEPFMAINEPFGWEGGTHNWTSVCAGSVGSAAIYLISNDGALARLIRHVADAMDRYFLGFSPEGVCTEGVGYWMYGFSFFACFAELLYQRTGGRIDMMIGEHQERIATFIQRARMTDNLFPSFSDCGIGMNFNLGLFEHLHRKFKSVEMPPAKYMYKLNDDHCFRFCNFIRSMVWYSGELPEAGQPQGDTFFDGAQWAISRAGDGTAFAAKGGYNAEPHNQNDVGQFILLSKGEMLFPDLGAGVYSRQYFGPKRYSDFFNNGSQGHSVPMINGITQSHGFEYAAKDYKHGSDGTVTTVSMDIGGTYVLDGLNSIKRTLSFNKDTKRMTLEDAFDMESPFEITERIIAASVKTPKLKDGEAVVFGKNTTGAVIFDANLYKCEISQAPEDAKFGRRDHGVYTIDLIPKTPDKQLKFKVEIQV